MVIVGWARFFGYFLMIRQISKLIMTLIRMLVDTISFVFIVVCYLLLVSTIYTILFEEAMPEEYGTLSLSYRTLFDTLIGVYVYTERSNYLVSNSIITMIHVFIANIFLFNYLVAILSTVYSIMEEEGEFAYKSSKY